MTNKEHNSWIILLSGMGIGVCLSLALGFGLLYSYSPSVQRQQIQVPEVQIPQPTLLPSVLPPQTATPASFNALDEAEAALDDGEPEKVQELLYPKIETWTSNDDRIRGYKLLGEAELMQGHSQLAVPFFDQLYFYQPTAENLFLLATIYDASGDNKNALARYRELDNWESLPPDVDREVIQARIYHISRALGTPLPTYTPTLTETPWQ